MQHQRQRGDVLAAVDGEVARVRPPPARLSSSLPRPRSAVASLMPTMPGTCASRSAVSLREIGDGPAGHVVEDQRQVDRFGDRAEMPVQPFLRRLVVVRARPTGSSRAGLLRVGGELDRFARRVGAGAGDDGHAAARDARPPRVISRQCSSTSTVGDSPVVPTMTMPAVPLATWKSISLPSAGRSSAPPSCIGVAIATRLPVNIENEPRKGGILPHSTRQRPVPVHLGSAAAPAASRDPSGAGRPPRCAARRRCARLPSRALARRRRR